MESKIEQSLDDIIKKNKISKKGVAKKLSGGRSGAKGSKRTKKVAKNHNGKPQLKFRKNGKYFSSSEPAKLKISNLDFGVTADDLLELFSDFGTLKSTSLIKDKSGRSLGSANVIFEKKNDAIKAMKEFHGVPLDGKLMKIQLTQAEIMPKNGPRMDKNSPKRNFDNGKSKFKDGRVAKTKNGSTKKLVHGTKKEAHSTKKEAHSTKKEAHGTKKEVHGGTKKIAKPTAEDLDKELDDYLGKKEDTENGITKTEIEQKPSEKKGKKKGGRGTKKESEPKPTAEDLDKEMDDYMKVRSK